MRPAFAQNSKGRPQTQRPASLPRILALKSRHYRTPYKRRPTMLRTLSARRCARRAFSPVTLMPKMPLNSRRPRPILSTRSWSKVPGNPGASCSGPCPLPDPRFAKQPPSHLCRRSRRHSRIVVPAVAYHPTVVSIPPLTLPPLQGMPPVVVQQAALLRHSPAVPHSRQPRLSAAQQFVPNRNPNRNRKLCRKRV